MTGRSERLCSPRQAKLKAAAPRKERRSSPHERMFTGMARIGGVSVHPEKSQSVGKDLALLLIDVDCFKGLQQSLRPSRGGNCLRESATAFAKRHNRVTSWPATGHGVRSFAASLSDTSSARATHVADNLWVAVRERAIEHELPNARL